MKKIFTLSSLFLAAALSLNAQDLKTINGDANAGELEVLAVSNNGQFVCGTTLTSSYFIYDTATKSFKWQAGPEDASGDPADSQLRHITDEGVAVGYAGDYPIMMDKDGNVTQLDTLAGDEEHATSLAFDVTNDGKTIVGCAFTTYSVPLIWQDGKLSQLPMPTEDEAGYTVNGAVAKFISSDGSIILGYIEDDMASYPAMIWTRQDDGSYAYDIISANYFEPGYGTNPYWTFTPECISANGRYIGISADRNVQENWDAGNYDDIGTGQFCLYDTQEKTVTEISIDGEHSIDADAAITPCGIADDGTVVGFTGSAWDGDAQGFIKRAADAQPLLLKTVYSDVTAFDDYVKNGSSLCTGISADGNILVGYGPNELGYEGWVLNCSVPAGIGSAAADNASDAVLYRYSVDGKRINMPTRGINLVKRANGRVEKTFVK